MKTITNKPMKKIFYLTILSFLFFACTKDKTAETEIDVLPEITEIGANTAGVEIDGQVLIPRDGINTSYGGSSIIKGLDVTAGSNFISSNGNDRFTLFIKNLKRPNGFILLMEIGILNQTGSIFTSNSPFLPKIYVGKVINGTVQKQFYSKENSCEIIITKLDFTTGIISGTFKGNVFDENNNVIVLKNGRFDVKII
jgi:hypothetical protein